MSASQAEERVTVFQQVCRAVRKVLRKFESHRDDVREEAAFEFRVKLERDELDGGWVATCLDLPGCVSQGETPREALENLTDAIGGVLTVRMQAHLPTVLLENTNGQTSYDVALNA